MYSITLYRCAEKALRKIQPDIQQYIYTTILSLSEDPYYHLERLHLNSNPPLYKLRAGAYRIIVAIIPDEKVIVVVDIGHRSTIYKRYS